MLNHLDNYFFSLEEPHRSCLLFLRSYILDYSDKITEQWKFNTPFYYYNNKWLCYISYHKKTKKVYIGFIHGYLMKHAKLLSEGRKQIKVFYIEPEKDIDIKSLNSIFKMACNLQELKGKKK
jgi:hypothetical protein